MSHPSPPRPSGGLHHRWQCPIFHTNWRNCTAYCSQCVCYVCNLTFHTCRCGMSHRWACPEHLMMLWERDRRAPPCPGARREIDLSGHIAVASVEWGLLPALVPSNVGVSVAHLSEYLSKPVGPHVWAPLVGCLDGAALTPAQNVAASLVATNSAARLHDREMVAKMFRSDGQHRDITTTLTRVDPALHRVRLTFSIARGQHRGSAPLLQLFGLAEGHGGLVVRGPGPGPQPAAAARRSPDPRLLPHQREGVGQMEEIERRGLTARLWQQASIAGTEVWVSPGTGAYVTDAVHPPACALHGGLLCNDRGTGKTRVVAALIAAHRAPPGWPGATATLVVVPTSSLIGQWIAELELYGLQTAVLFGRRQVGAAERNACDVVLTTSAMLRNHRGGLLGHDAVWWRVVFDEGHRTLSNGWRPNKTGEAFADAASTARNRWLVTGTPDWSHGRTVGYVELLFGRVDGGDRWHETSPVGLSAQWTVACAALSVRTGTPPCMPRVRYMDHPLEPPAGWLQRYRTVERRAQELHAHATGRGPQLLLTRLLQAAGGAAAATLPDVASLNRERPVRDLPCDVVDCTVCLEQLVSPVVTPCKHYFCRRCITTWLRGHAGCPLCRTPIEGARSLAPCISATAGAADGCPELPGNQHKVERLAGLVLAAANAAPRAVLCFSRYPAVRRRLLALLERHEIDVTDRLERFMARPTKVLLLSPQACGVGLNLTQASTVVLCEPAARRSLELQAIGRAVRMGQLASEVVVHRPYVVGTVEERLRHRSDEEAQELNIATALGVAS